MLRIGFSLCEKECVCVCVCVCVCLYVCPVAPPQFMVRQFPTYLNEQETELFLYVSEKNRSLNSVN